VWMPARISTRSSRMRSVISSAQRIARAGPSKVAKKPSPAVSFSTPRHLERFAHDRVVLLDEVLPTPVPERSLLLGRTDDVGEQDGRKDRLEFRRGSFHPEERAQQVQERFVLVGAQTGRARDLCNGHERRHVLCRLAVLHEVFVDDTQSRYVHGREHSRTSVSYQILVSSAATSGVAVCRLCMPHPRTSFGEATYPSVH